MLEVSFCKYYNADGDFFQEQFLKLKGVFIMKEINLEVNIMKPEDNFFDKIYNEYVKEKKEDGSTEA